jgi:glycosyltransferase involved in cell wall biosynthesis
MTRILIASTDIVASAMAGPGIRAWEIANALASDHQVTLAVPRATDLSSSRFTIEVYSTERHDPVLARVLGQCDLVILQGSMVEAYPLLLETHVPVAIDLYDPLLIEGLDIVAGADRATAESQFARYQRLTESQLRRGDFFFCATERQRDYWLGALTAVGRITPDLISAVDRELRDLIDLVPSGIAAKAAPLPAVLRGVHPAIAKDDLILLWAGGLWDWFEPDLLVRAVAELSIEFPRLKLVFFGGARPAPTSAAFRTSTHARAYALASELDVLDRSVIFIEEWVPYAQRSAYLQEADIGVSAHRPGVETRLAFRTRLLDYIWARLPIIVSSGDGLGEELTQSGMGLLVAPGDLGGWVQAIRQLAQDAAQRDACRQAAETVAARYAWAEVIRPLARFCAKPRRTAPNTDSMLGKIAELGRTLRERDAYIQHVEQQYHNAIEGARKLEQSLQHAPLPRLRSGITFVQQAIQRIRRVVSAKEPKKSKSRNQ